MSRLRVLYVPNEAGEFRQLGFRGPLAKLVSSGQIAAASVFSLQWRILNGGDPEQHRQHLIRRISSFKPDVVLMQHLGVTGLRNRHFRAMRQAAQFELIYHEADPYSRYLHPLPRPARAAGQAADVVYTIGTGTFRENFVRAGAQDVRWSPHVFEPERYPFSPVLESSSRDYDVVIVANRNTPRFRGHPNWKDRIRFVELMQERFGDRLAVYGRGWEGIGAKGAIDFSLQNQAIRSAWVSANWDHYAAESGYFSNRLPISLASGSIHATTRHPGYDEIFPRHTEKFLILQDSIRGLAENIAEYLSATSPAERISAAKEAQEFAYKYYRQDDQVVQLLNAKTNWIDPEKARLRRDDRVPPLDEM